MANELNIQLGQTGLTVTAQLVQAAAQVGGDISLAESGTLSGFYSGNMPAVSAGVYLVRFVSGGSAVGSGQIVWDGSAEIDLSDLSQFDHSTDSVSVSGIAANVIDAAALATSAITAIQSGLATAAAVAAIPTNPLLGNDTRLNNLDAAISSRSSHGAPDLSNLDIAVSTRLASAGYTAPDNGGITTLTTRLSAARAGYLDKLNVTGSLAHSDAAAAYRADVSGLALEATLTDIKGATFNPATDSLEAIRDRGDAAWTTGSGGGSGGDDAATIYTYFTSSSRADAFKADVSNLDVAVSTRLAATGQTAILSAIANLPAPSDATLANQTAILNALTGLDDLAKANEVITPTNYRKLRVSNGAALVNKAVVNDGNGNITLTEV